jgi:putative transposase
MARMPRFFLPNTPLHVIVRGNNRSAIFASDDDREFMRAYLQHVTRVNGVAVHAYVFMTNHIHMLATPLTASSMPRAMQMLGRTYVRFFNDKYSRTGTLWEGRYRAAIVDDEHYLLLCMRYIELNPVRAGMVGHPSQHPWSSFGRNALGFDDPVVTSHALYTALGIDAASRQRGYCDAIGVCVCDAELDRIRDATQNGWALGSKTFLDRVSRVARRAERRRGGRPRTRSPGPEIRL